jgi:DNA polymerase/3'-5' exonuclease PolX
MNDKAGSINARCADRLREAADLLEAQGANPFRVSAYRKAATHRTRIA